MKKKIISILNEHKQAIDSIIENNLNEIENLCSIILSKILGGGKILFAGNGGSAADSQHLAAEFVGRFTSDRIPLPAIALTTDTSIITAIANDYGYSDIFARQIVALCNSKDVLIAISTSGNSENLIRGIEEAKKKSTYTVGLLGKDGGKMNSLVDFSLIVNETITARIQECHILIGHIICDICNEHFTNNNK